MIATYIQELLATNNRVIVPNYGAFLVRATSKSKDANTLEEKLADIYFSPFLKFNDELLEKYIVKKENITKEQAAEKIQSFIDDIKKELEQEKPFEIKGFGQFTSDKQGKVQFTTFAKEKTPEKDDKEKVEKPAAKKTTATKKTSSAVKKEETKAEETKIEKTTQPAKETTGKLKEFKVEEKPKTEAIKEEPKKQEIKTAPVEQKPVYSYKKQKKPVNKGLIWSIAIGLPVAAVFIWALLNFNTVKKVFNKDKAKTEQVAKKKTTTTTKKAPVKTKKNTEQTNKQTTKTTTKPAEKKVVEQKPAPKVKKYYIIAGSFKNEKYAISYLNKLKAEGYNAEKLAERNGMYAISYNSFTDKRKAIAEYKFLSQEKGLQAWILYY